MPEIGAKNDEKGQPPPVPYHEVGSLDRITGDTPAPGRASLHPFNQSYLGTYCFGKLALLLPFY